MSHQQEENIQALPSASSIEETSKIIVSNPTSPTTTTPVASQYHSQLETLKRLPVPYSDIYHVLSSYDTIPLQLLSIKFRKAAAEMTIWLDNAKLAVLGLEMEVKQGMEVKQETAVGDKKDVNQIDMVMNRFQPNVEMMMELKDKVGIRLQVPSEVVYQKPSCNDKDVTGREEASLTELELEQTTKMINSSWLALKTMQNEVMGIFASAQSRREILTQMEEVLAEIEEIGLGTDRFQDERSRQQSPDMGQSVTLLEAPSSPPFSVFNSTSSTDSVASSSEDVHGKQQRNNEALAGLDNRIEALTPRVEALTVQIEEIPSHDFKRDELQDQYQELLRLWEDTKTRREKISDELKEERWLAVFEQVAGQVESMMESMDRAIVHCKGLVDQIKAMVREKVIPTAPIDRDHLYTIFKSFEAKHKYYAPAVTKMLNMLENGIESRATKNTDVIQKQQAMKSEWERLRGSLDRVELDLDGIEEMLDHLDASIPSYIPTPPSQLPEKPLFAMRRSQTSAEWKSPGPQALFKPPQQIQQPQRGRRPLLSSSSLQSPSESPKNSTFGARDRSPLNQPRPRPWSPSPSVTSLSSMLSPNTYSNYRSLSRSPSRSPSRANSDKLRPWCPSTKTTSPSIPGIPYAPSAASTYTPRSNSSTRQGRDPSPSNGTLSRSTSSMSRARSTSCTPSLNGTPSQLRPVFSPAGSMSKLSTGAQPSSNRSTSPTPGFSASSGASGRKSQSKLPPLVVTNTSSSFRARQNSAPGTPTPQQRRSSSPIPSSASGRDREGQTSSRQYPQVFSPPTAGTTPDQQRQSSAQNGRSTSQMGYRSQQQDDGDSTAAAAAALRNRRPSLSNSSTVVNSSQAQTTSYQGGRIDTSVNGSGLSSTSGSAASMGLEVYAVPPFEEPTSPSTSSNSSVNSLSRLQPSRFQLQQEQQHQEREQQAQQQQMKSACLDSSQTTSRTRSHSATTTAASRQYHYIPTRGDELDEEFARIVNASLIRMQVRRLSEGKYYFGGRMEERGNGKIVALGGKTGLCRLMEYNRTTAAATAANGNESGVSTGGSHSGVEDAALQQQQGSRKTLRRPEPAADRSTRSRASSFNASTHASSAAGTGKNRKVMVRVGGGWQDLDVFLLDHSSLGNA